MVSYLTAPVLTQLCLGSQYDSHTSEVSYQPDLLEPLAFLRLAANAHCCQVDVHRDSALCAYKGIFFFCGSSIYETNLSFLKPVPYLR